MTDRATKDQAAERKRRQRARKQSEFGLHRVELQLSDREHEMLLENCRIRNVGGVPYLASEYISLLILCDNEILKVQIKALLQCDHCGYALPDGCDGAFKGESACFHTRDFRSLNLTDVTGHAQILQQPPFSLAELDLFRQWFNSMEDTNKSYINDGDRSLYAKVMRMIKGGGYDLS